jgi:WD40 repeat protein
MVKRLATFDKKSINLEQPVEHVSLHHLVTEEARAMEVRKPFYETASCGSVKKMIAVSDSNFIAGFSGSPCLKYYRNDDYKPIFSTQITAPSALATYSKQGRHYCIYGDASGRLGVVKIDTFEKEYDEFNMHKNIITDIKHHRENRFLSCSSDGTIRAWKVDE